MLQTNQNLIIGKQFAQEFLDEISDELNELLVKLSPYHTKKQGAPGAILTMLLLKFQEFIAHASATNFTVIENNVIEFNRTLIGFRQLGTGELDIVIHKLERLRNLVDEQARPQNTSSIRENTSRDIPVLAGQISPAMKHLLLICTERTLSMIIGRSIKQLGFEVDFVSNSQDIQNQIETNSPSFIICNATIGDTSGVDIIHNLKQIKANQAIPMAILTSFQADHPMFANLPANTPILRKGENFNRGFSTSPAKI